MPFSSRATRKEILSRTAKPKDYKVGWRVENSVFGVGTVREINPQYVFVKFDKYSGTKAIRAWELQRYEE